MAAAYSQDLRTRVMQEVDSGMSAEVAAVKFSVSARAVYSWKALKRETGAFAPRQGITGPKPKLDPYRDSITAGIQSNPDVTLEELRSQLKLPGCLQTLANALRRWGIVLKKSHSSRRTAAA